MINDSIFSHRPIGELMSIVKNDFRKLDNEGLIDEGTLVKTVMYCNDKLGIPIREVREIAIPVFEGKAQLPLDFEKLYYVCALKATNTFVTEGRNPFDNSFDSDVVYEAKLDRDSIGCLDNYQVVIKKDTETTIHQHGSWIELDLDPGSRTHCHIDCPNKRKKGKHTISIKDGYIETPFRAGMLYLMYIGMMKDQEGNITFPFHPLITPYYEWSIKEKVLSDAIFNSDITNISDMYKIANEQRKFSWLDAYNFTVDSGFGSYIERQRKKELGWYNQYFKYFQ